jgi:hypothetical protein
MVNGRNKGAAAEREALELLGIWLAPAYVGRGLEVPKLLRNLEQVRSGGQDIVGIDWLSVEVKRHETITLRPWWEQTLRQTGEGQVPFLLWRGNRMPWQARTRVQALHAGKGVSTLTVDLDGPEQIAEFLRNEAWWRLA